MLRPVEFEHTPLSEAELQERGNDLATQIRQAAVDAVRQSMHSEFLAKGKTLTVKDLRQWRHRARTALEAWQKVDALTSELLNEVKRHEEAHWRHELVETRPGRYEYVRVPITNSEEHHEHE